MGRAGTETGRGRQAERPQDIPKPGWRDILWRTKAELSQDDVSMVAGSIAFYGLLAMFPAIAAMISIWGLLFDPQQIAQQIESVSGALPRRLAGGAGARSEPSRAVHVRLSSWRLLQRLSQKPTRLAPADTCSDANCLAVTGIGSSVSQKGSLAAAT